MFDHEKLDVYQLSLKFVTWVYQLAKKLSGLNRHARDQLVRSSQSITQNIAEGNGKRSLVDRQRYFEISRGSAFECAATLDILYCCEAITSEERLTGKQLLHRIVCMLSKMTQRSNQVREKILPYITENYDYEHRYAEHEHRCAEHEYKTSGKQF